MNKLKKIAAAVSSFMILQSTASIVSNYGINAAAENNEPVIIYEENGYYMGDVNDSSAIDAADLVIFQKWAALQL